ncbi:MAG: extracellular solute-binding protein [Oscillospiraceae bacterium]|jgi:iron(III) transport system substrate-binding protein|nr:extracellular solute-binding protein [Oscillospiraceae bacterium]
MGKRLTALLMGMVCLLSGCAAKQAAPRGYAPEVDNRLIIYTSHKPDVYTPIIKEFEERTGIWVTLESGGTSEMLDRIAAESESPKGDIMFGGGVESLEDRSAYFDPITKPDLLIRQAYYKEDSPWLPFSSLPQVIIYNSLLLSPMDAPTGWQSLLDPRWRGKIAFADPTVSGSSYTALLTILQALPQSEEAALAAFIENLDGLILAGSGDVVGAVAQGDCLVGVTLEETALKAIAQGVDIQMVYPSEGTSDIPDGVALIKGGSHRENALLFIDFILSHAVQSRLASDFSRRPVIVLDAAAADAPEDFVLISYDIAWAGKHKSDLLGRWQALAKGAGL